MNKGQAQIRFWGGKYFANLLSAHRYALVLELVRLHLVRLCCLCFLLLNTSGCSMISGTRHPDGRLVVTTWRLLWKSEAIRFTTNDATNFAVTLAIGKSNTDDEAVAAVTEAAVKAALKSVVPIP